jgi:glycosyltransferase involved in cell wall biosynthesis
MPVKKILHFRIWRDPPIAASVEAMLRVSYPEDELEVITLWERIKADKRVMLRNVWAVVREYGWDILSGRLQFKAAFFRTVFLFKHVQRLAGQIGAQRENVRFTIQLQSIFDTHIAGIPHFIYTDHTHLANLLYSPAIRVHLYSAEWIACEKSIYANADRVFTRSSNISRSLTDQYGIAESKVRCIYAGANTPIAAIDPRKKDYSARHILFVGLDWERKGGPQLVEAFRQLRVDFPDAALTIVGSSVPLDAPGINVVGRVSVDALDAYYQAATIFCMPSRNEPFGVVFVEAMAHALPIVAARIGALPDMVEDDRNGYLVPVDDGDALTRALGKLLQSEERRAQFGQQSWQLAQERYNWKAVGKTLRNYTDEYFKAGK